MKKIKDCLDDHWITGFFVFIAITFCLALFTAFVAVIDGFEACRLLGEITMGTLFATILSGCLIPVFH
jgi:hypothetical protein